MIIWINKKTGISYPEHGGNFTYWNDYKIKPNKFYCFIHDIGWKYYPAKDWESKIIPDLYLGEVKNDSKWIQHHPNTFRAYVKEYGWDIAIAQLPCADFCKSSWGAVLLDPIYPADDIQEWFYQTFNPKDIGDDIYPDFMKKSLWNFMVSSIGMIFGKFTFDILKFEDHLVSEFDYDKNSNQSMSQFMVQTFGQENHDKFKKELIDNLTSKKKKDKVSAVKEKSCSHSKSISGECSLCGEPVKWDEKEKRMVINRI